MQLVEQGADPVLDRRLLAEVVATAGLIALIFALARSGRATLSAAAVGAYIGADPARKPAVLFVCAHNAGRSQMAAGWLAHLAGDAIEVRSAGTMPAEQVNPVVDEAMREVGIDITPPPPRPSPPHRPGQ